MKLKLIKFSLCIIVSSILTSCVATHIGNMTGSASLNAPNFNYHKQNVYGESNATYVLGIGGLAKNSLIIEAKKNMLNSNPLLKNQALSNVSVSYKTTRFLIFIVSTVKCTVSADIVEFGLSQLDSSQNHVNLKILPKINSLNPEYKLENKTIDNSLQSETKFENKPIIKISNGPIQPGDIVKIINYFSTPITAKVIEIINSDYLVEYKKSNNKLKRIKVLSFQVEKVNN